jgi:predicted NBD/HSP70 family sugar kinase
VAAGSGWRQEALRRANLSRLLGHVHRAGEISRSALAGCTGLNRSTVGTLVGELADRGLVEETMPPGPKGPGRPSPVVRPAGGGVVVLAGDIEVDSVSCAAIGVGGQIYAERRVERPRERLSAQQTLDDLCALFASTMAEVAGRRIVGVGVAVVGVVRRRDGFVHLAPNLGWRDVPFADLLAEGLALDVPVSVGNEADLGALAEHVRGAGVGVDDLIYLSGEVGVGAGIIVGGAPLVGADGYAGEVGHLTVDPDGAACGCGSRGCWETHVGERAILRAAGLPENGGRAALTSLLREAAAGTPHTTAALAGVGRWLGIGMAGLVNVFNPRRIVLGGLFAQTYPYLAEALRAELGARARLPSRPLVDLTSARLGERSPLVGAAELALAPLLADPTIVPAERVAETATAP